MAGAVAVLLPITGMNQAKKPTLANMKRITILSRFQH
jgi:hypothetical protein